MALPTLASMSRDWHASFESFAAGLAESDAPFFTGLAHGSMTVALFEPAGRDTQTPHTQDELYIVREGTARFTLEGDTVLAGPGDVLFVRAGLDHRFSQMSDGFSTWVVFWGPRGGETG